MVKILTPIKSIRAKCIECSAGSRYEVKMCPCKNCPLWLYRFGKRPTTQKKKKVSETNSKVTSSELKNDIKRRSER